MFCRVLDADSDGVCRGEEKVDVSLLAKEVKAVTPVCDTTRLQS